MDEDGNIVGGRYLSVSDPVAIGDRIAFKAEDGKEQFIVNEAGETVGGRYEYVSIPKDIWGRIAFWARNGTGLFVVNERGRKGMVVNMTWYTISLS